MRLFSGALSAVFRMRVAGDVVVSVMPKRGDASLTAKKRRGWWRQVAADRRPFGGWSRAVVCWLPGCWELTLASASGNLMLQASNKACGSCPSQALEGPPQVPYQHSWVSAAPR